MRIISIIRFWILAFLLSGTLYGYIPDLESRGKIQSGAQPLKVDRYSVPFVADWNDDGAKDLIVGQYMWGYVWIYLNQGTNLNPEFGRGQKITSSGEPISMPFS